MSDDRPLTRAEYEEAEFRKSLLSAQSRIEKKMDKVFWSIAGLTGAHVGLVFVHTTLQEVFMAVLGGWLAFFSPLVLYGRWKNLGYGFRGLLFLNTLLGGSILYSLAVGPNIVSATIVVVSLVPILVLLNLVAWKVENYAVKP